jgi:phytoene dehydrogenase-like protein
VVEQDIRRDSAVSQPSPEPGIDQARETSYDAVVIGGGIGGLTAGALLARAGKKVLVAEAEARPGGFARALRRGPYTFDRADHLLFAGCEEAGPFGPGLIDAVLRHLGVRDRCQFVRMGDPMYEARFPDLTLSVPSGVEAYLEAHLRHFPGEAAGLRRLVALSAAIFREFSAFPVKPNLPDLLMMPRRFPTLFRYRNATMKQVIDRELTDPRLKAAYATWWGWIGPPPSQASFLMWAAMMGGYIHEGPHYPLGSFQRLADTLAAGFTQAGGELLLGTRATRILADGRRVQGVVLEGGQQVSAPVVISNIDPRETFDKLLGSRQVSSRYLRRLGRTAVAHSIIALYAATDLDVQALGAKHDITLFTGWDHERAFQHALAGEVPVLSGPLIPTLKDPSLAPPGEHLVILKAIAPARAGEASWESREFADRMLEVAERVLPGLRQHLTFVDEGVAGNRLHNLGPYLGWALTPQQSGIRRLPQQAPLGLVLVGQWTQPGPGVWTVIRSGIGAARLVLGVPTSAPALPLGV